MTCAKIYKPVKTPSQSGKFKFRSWILEFNSAHFNFTDSIMGWRGSKDTFHQVRLTFSSLEAAIAYARKNGIDIQVEEPSSPSPVLPKKYSDNFRYEHLN